jgi:hypothetical protein
MGNLNLNFYLIHNFSTLDFDFVLFRLNFSRFLTQHESIKKKMLKSNWTCSYCSKIVKDPIDLPCDDSICRQHLSEKAVVKENKIKCNECSKEFRINDEEFRSNKSLRKLIESQSYLSGEEISLKKELRASIRLFFEYYDEFNQKKTQLESDVFDHFQEMRFKIDEHREELKKRIDDIALAMIDETWKHQEKYLRDLKEKLSSINHCKSLEHDLNKIEETFRHPNLIIETIKEMQKIQAESLRDIQFNLNQMNQVKDNLNQTNYFNPSSLLFKPEETLFGSIQLGLYSNTNSFKGQILTSEQTLLQVIELCEFSSNDKWSLLYRGTRDGFGGSDDFHSQCDGHSNTFTIFKAKESEFIFGGFTAVEWDGSSIWKSDPNAFIFSLTNKDNKPLKMKIHPYKHEYAIECHSSFGPTFSFDIRIANNANTTMSCSSNLGFAYKHPQYGYGTNEAQTFLAGSYSFQLDEIEVYQKD